MKKFKNIVFNSRDEFIKLEIDKIVYFESEGNYTNIVMTNSLKYMVRLNLGETERALAEQLAEEASIFIRIGKQHIVNKNFISSINILKQRLILSDYVLFVYRLDISREALKRLKELMKSNLI